MKGNRNRTSQLARLAVSLAALAGCGSDEDPAPRGACADPAAVLALPHPGWQAAGPGLLAPDSDRAAELLRAVRPSWVADLASVDGWPRRPTLLVPLDAPATEIDPSALRLYGSAAGEPTGALAEVEVAVEASLDADGRTLLVQPRDPLPPGVGRAVLAVGAAAVQGASPQPVCAADGQPYPSYGEALADLPADADAALALPFSLASTASDLGRLYRALANEPVLEVVSAETRGLDSFGEHSPPAEVAALLAPTAVSGILSLPAYQNERRIFELDEAAVPAATGTTRPGFVLVLPAAGDPPYPFVLYQHGGTQQKENILPIAGPLAAAGFALLAIDLPFHGDRAPPGGGSDLDILDFDDPLATRDNLRQASADHLAVLTGIDALNEAVADLLGSAPILDPTRGHYLGLSLGGVTGTFTVAAAADLRAAALFVGGGGYPEILSSGLFSIYLVDLLAYEGAERAALLGLLEALLDGADPLASAAFEDRSAAPRPVLFFEAIGDPVIPNAATDQWARAFGAAVAEPAEHPVAGTQSVALPATDNFAWPSGADRTTRLLIQAPMAEIEIGERHGGLIRQPYSQAMVAHCFASLASAGSCEAYDTGFADH